MVPRTRRCGSLPGLSASQTPSVAGRKRLLPGRVSNADEPTSQGGMPCHARHGMLACERRRTTIAY